MMKGLFRVFFHGSMHMKMCLGGDQRRVLWGGEGVWK